MTKRNTVYHTRQRVLCFCIFIIFCYSLFVFAQQGVDRNLIMDIRSTSLNNVVIIYGKIVKIEPPVNQQASIIVHITDGTGTMKFVITRDILAKIPEPGRYKLEELVWARGRVTQFEPIPEVVLESPNDFILVTDLIQQNTTPTNQIASVSIPTPKPPSPAATKSPSQQAPTYPFALQPTPVSQAVAHVQQTRPSSSDQKVSTQSNPFALDENPAQAPVLPAAPVTPAVTVQAPTPATPQNTFPDQPIPFTQSGNITALVPGSQLPITPINTISLALEGKRVKVRGTIVRFRAAWKLSAPNIATVSDGTGELDCVYWNVIDEKIPADKKPAVGMTFEFVGGVDQYRGNVQIRIDSPADIIFISNTPSIPVTPVQ